ncbi:MAG: hypothetical protein GF334_05805 [Candidatus Altiarchaeales archaeon]|nr:hypothetical protein [Candidatus Altiarchaeales archaeon]
MRSVRKNLKKSRESILSRLRVKQKPELDSKVRQIKPKTLRQSIKFMVPAGRRLGGTGFVKRGGYSIGNKLF